MYNNWQMAFKRACTQEQEEKADLEKRLVEFFEKSFWQKISPYDRFLKFNVQYPLDHQSANTEIISGLESLIRNSSV